LFNENDVAKNPKITTSKADVEYCNIRMEENPKMVKLSKALNLEVKKDYVNLMKDFPDIFAWSYDDLKLYDTKVIQHVIPIKEGQKNFKQNLRWINPLLLSLIKKEVNHLFNPKIIMSFRF
jgi:hypothetical protein